MAGYRPVPLLLVVVLAGVGCAYSVGLNDALDLIRLGRQVVVEAMESWEMIAPRLPADKLPTDDLVLMKTMERELLKRMDLIAKQIDEYQERTEIRVDTILAQLLLQLPMQRRLDDSLKQLDHYIGQVQGLYGFFELYANHPDRYEKYTMLQFAKTCVSPKLGELPDVLKSIHRLMVPSQQQVYNNSILVLLANQMEVGTGFEDVIEEADGVSWLIRNLGREYSF